MGQTGDRTRKRALVIVRGPLRVVELSGGGRKLCIRRDVRKVAHRVEGGYSPYKLPGWEITREVARHRGG